MLRRAEKAEAERDRYGREIDRLEKEKERKIESVICEETSRLEKERDAAVIELAEAGALLEVLRMESERKPYQELSTEFQANVVKRTDSVRAFLANFNKASPKVPQ